MQPFTRVKQTSLVTRAWSLGWSLNWTLSWTLGISLAVSAAPSAAQAAIDSVIAGDIVNVTGQVYLRSDKKNTSLQVRTAKAGDPVYEQDIINTAANSRIKVLMRDKSIIDLGPSALFKVDEFSKKPKSPERQVVVSMIYGTMRAAITQKLDGQSKFKVKTPSATMGVRGTEFVVKSEVKNLGEVSRMLNNPSTPSPPSSFAKDGAQTANTQITVLQGKVDVGKKDSDLLGVAKNQGRTPSSAASGGGPVVSLSAGTQLTTSNALKTESGTSAAAGTAMGAAVKPTPGSVPSSDRAPAAIANASPPPPGNAPMEAPKQMDATQLKAVSSEAKVADNTFQKAVTIDTSQSSSGSSGANQSPIQQMVTSVTALPPPPPPVKPSDLGIPGTIGANQAFNQPINNANGGQKRLHITIKQ